jgi:hypothetical protein
MPKILQIRNAIRKLVRKPHIVPRFYLANFHDFRGQLHVYEKGKDVRLSVAGKEAVERDFYEFTIGSNTPNRIENWLSYVEDRASRVIGPIIKGQQLDKDDVATWSIFLALLFLRTRKVRQQIVAGTFAALRQSWQSEGHLRDLQHELIQRGEFVYTERLKDTMANTLKQMEAQPGFLHAATLERVGLNLAKAVGHKRWQTVDAPSGKAFLTSDSPVVTLALDGKRAELGFGFGRSNVAVLLPLTPSKLFLASPPDIHWQETLPEQDVDLMNTAIVRFAHKNVFSNETTPETRNLVDSEIDNVVFGKNAFCSSQS